MLRLVALAAGLSNANGVQLLSSVRKLDQELSDDFLLKSHYKEKNVLTMSDAEFLGSVASATLLAETESDVKVEPLFDPAVTPVDQMLANDQAAMNSDEDTIGAVPEAAYAATTLASQPAATTSVASEASTVVAIAKPETQIVAPSAPVAVIDSPLAVQNAVAAADAANAAAAQMHDQAVAEAQARAEELAQAAARADAAAVAAQQLREQAIQEAAARADAASAQADQLRAQLAAAEQAKSVAEQTIAAAEGTKTAAEQQGVDVSAPAPAGGSAGGGGSAGRSAGGSAGCDGGCTGYVLPPAAGGTVGGTGYAPVGGTGTNDDITNAIASSATTQALSAGHVTTSIIGGIAVTARHTVPETTAVALPAYDLSQDVPGEVRKSTIEEIAKDVVADLSVDIPSAINAVTGAASADIPSVINAVTAAALPAYNLSADSALPASLFNTVPTQALASAGDDNCSNIEGHYETAQGDLVTIFQTGCYLTVQHGPVVRSGKMIARDLVVEGFEQAGRVSDVGDVFFANGERWMKTQAATAKVTTPASTTNVSEAQPESKPEPEPESEPAQGGPEESSAEGDLEASDFTVKQSDLDQTMDLETLSPPSAGALDISPLINHEEDVTAGVHQESLTAGALATSFDKDSVQREPEDKCVDVGGHYKNKAGQLVTVKQDGCSLIVLMKWYKDGEEVIKKGTADGNFVRVDSFKQMAAKIGENLEFMQGATWEKIAPADFASVPKGHCNDLSGYYSDHSGKLVTVEQVGCHTIIKSVDSLALNQSSFALNQSSTAGTVAGNDMKIVDSGKVAHRMIQSDDMLGFEDGSFWGKLSEEEATASASCREISGNYRDAQGRVATIGQEQCDIQLQMFWDDEEGDITLKGHVFGDALHVKNFHTLGKVNATTGSIIFKGKKWIKLTDEKSTELAIPKAGCVNFAGEYKDGQGKPAIMEQIGCSLKVEFWLDTVDSNVTKSGYVSQDTVHIQDFTAVGGLELSSGNIMFSNVAVWQSVLTASASLGVASFVSNTTWEVGDIEESIRYDCDSFAGTYTDRQGKPVYIKQTGCDLEVSFWFDSSGGFITQPGHVNGKTMTVPGFETDGVASEAGIKFKNTEWISNAKSAAKSADHPANITSNTMDGVNPIYEEVPACANFGGVYADKEGKPVVVHQTKCDVNVTFWLASASTNITQAGYVAGQQMHVQDFAEVGEASDAGIRFASAEWSKTADAEEEPIVFDSASMPEDVDDIMRNAIEGGEDLTGKEIIPVNLDPDEVSSSLAVRDEDLIVVERPVVE